MTEPGYHDAHRVLCQDARADLHPVLAAACEPAPARDPAVCLADFARQVLVPLAAGAARAGGGGDDGRPGVHHGQPVTSDRDGPVRVRVPVVEQTTRTGVLAVTVPHADPQILAQAESFGVFTGLVVAAATRVSDVPHQRRRSRAMSLPAVMQWDLLPPLSARRRRADRRGAGARLRCRRGRVRLRGQRRRSAPGHLRWPGARHRLDAADRPGRRGVPARPPGRGPGGRHAAAIDAALAGYYDDVSFATGIIARLTTGSGRLEWSCAGHPRPLLLRGRKIVAELSCDPVLPFGLGDGAPKPGIAELEPDNVLLLYTDGVTEARTADGELFGLDRLADLVEREAASGRTAEELLWRLVQSVLDHQAGGLRDDATLLLMQWTGT